MYIYLCTQTINNVETLPPHNFNYYPDFYYATTTITTTMTILYYKCYKIPNELYLQKTSILTRTTLYDRTHDFKKAKKLVVV